MNKASAQNVARVVFLKIDLFAKIWNNALWLPHIAFFTPTGYFSVMDNVILNGS